MIFESWPWKQDLHRRKSLLIKYNTPEHFTLNDERTYTVIEKSIFYSAFIIRKLIDCTGKLSDQAEQYSLPAKSIKPLKHINLLNRWPEIDSHNWEDEKSLTVKGRDVCNWLIHSYLFFMESNENETINAFYVSSDYDRNKVLYKILLSDWIDYIDFIASDNISQLISYFDEKKGEYIYVRKTREN